MLGRMATFFVRALLPALSLTLSLGACGGRSTTSPPRSPERIPSTSAAPSSPVTDAMKRASEAITADDLRSAVETLSSDRFEGRGVAAPGGELAMQYLEQQLRALGFAPAGPDGSYRQPFDVLGITARVPTAWSFRHGKQKVALAGATDYIVAPGDQAARTKLDAAELVFVGYGIEAPEYQWDDFKGQDLRGKILLMLNNDPDWDPALFAGETRLYYGRWTYKHESAARHGAAGAIIIHTDESAGYPFQVVQTSWGGERFELPRESEPRLALHAWTTEAATRKLLSLAGHDLDALIAAAKQRDFAPKPLGITTSIALDSTVRRVRTANVLGKLPGSDPMLRDEAVIYTAHHDHFGIGKPDARGDKIYNGAVDNAAGMAQLLAIAKGLKALEPPTRRSALVLFVGAEEQGLLGSQYYAAHPTYEPGAIAADINYDFANIWGRAADISFVGKEKSTLDQLVTKIAAVQGRQVLPDPMPDRGHYYRSDHFSFARIGVPAVSFGVGTAFPGRPEGWVKAQLEDYEEHRYHQPSDELGSDWNFDGMVEDARLGLWTGIAIANADAMPSWTPGDEFEAARKSAIEKRKAGR